MKILDWTSIGWPTPVIDWEDFTASCRTLTMKNRAAAITDCDASVGLNQTLIKFPSASLADGLLVLFS